MSLRETHPALRTDWHRLSQAAYGVALVEQTTEVDTPLPEAWQLFRWFLGEVNGRPWSPLTVLALELRHLADLGLEPELERESLPDRSRELALVLADPEAGAAVWPEPVPEEIWRPVSRFLHGFMIHHLGRLPRGRAEALSDRG